MIHKKIHMCSDQIKKRLNNVSTLAVFLADLDVSRQIQTPPAKPKIIPTFTQPLIQSFIGTAVGLDLIFMN